jgi:transposase-like protein
VDWNKIKAEYISGGTSYRKLCSKYGVSRTTLQRKAKDENWLGLRSQAEAKAESKIVNAVSDKSAKIDDKYFRLVDKLLDKAEEVIENTPVWQVTTLKEMANAMKYLKECKGVRSEADAREQEARIAKLQRETEKEDNTETEIKVTFGSTDKECTKWAE